MIFHPSLSPAAGRPENAGTADVRTPRCGLPSKGVIASCVLAALAVLALAPPPAAAAASKRVSVVAVRHWSLGDVTRIAVQTTGEFKFKFNRLSNPDRIYFDIINSRQRVAKEQMHAIQVDDGLIKLIRVSQNQRSVTRIVLDLAANVKVTSSQLANPDRLMIEVRRPGARPNLSKHHQLPPPGKSTARATPPEPKLAPKKTTAAPQTAKAAPPAPAEPKVAEKAVVLPPSAKKAAVAAAETSRPQPGTLKPPPPPPAVKKAEPAAKQVAAAAPPPPPEPAPEPGDTRVAAPAKRNRSGGHSLTRVLGLKLGRIVIDPGHGGKDTGTIGPSGLREKQVTLDVARRLAKLIEERLGSEVVLTRTKDSTVALKKRTEIANKNQADLFLSIHVNSSRYRAVNGVETFYLNFTRSRADLEVAARENAGSNRSMHELSTLVQKIALDDKVQESRDLASTLQVAAHRAAKKFNSKVRNRGVKKAPFVVLIGAQMPSVLVELGFISNPKEEKLMKRDDWRQATAEALYEGIAKYAATLSHYQVAQATSGE